MLAIMDGFLGSGGFQDGKQGHIQMPDALMGLFSDTGKVAVGAMSRETWTSMLHSRLKLHGLKKFMELLSEHTAPVFGDEILAMFREMGTLAKEGDRESLNRCADLIKDIWEMTDMFNEKNFTRIGEE